MKWIFRRVCNTAKNKLFEDRFKYNGTVELCIDNLKHIHGQKYIKKVDDYYITETTNLDSFINENCKYSNFLADLIVKIMSIEQNILWKNKWNNWSIFKC